MWGRRPEISWQAGQRNINIRNKRLSGWSLALYILYTAALSMLFLYAAAGMAADQLNIRLGDGQRGCVWVLGLVILLILGWNEVMHALRKRKLRWLGSFVLLGIVFGGCFRYYYELTEELIGGFYNMGQRYIDVWNRYFQTAYQLEPGNRWGEPLAWGLALIVVTTLLQTFSALLRKRTIMLLLPATVMAAEMTVGLTPGWRELACMSVAGLLSLYLDSQREFEVFPALFMAAALGLGLTLTALLMTKPAAKVQLLHDRLQTFQHQMEREIRDYDWQEFWRREGQVDNQSPQYEHKEMMTVTVNSVPEQTMYLRGYYGTDYQKGSWDTSEEEFNWASLRHGLSGSRAAGLLAGLNCSAHASLPGDKLRYELQYTGLHNTSAYLPYGADMNTARESYKLSGDYVVEKSKSLESFRFEGWDSRFLTRDGSERLDDDAESFYRWYNKYVQDQYLGVKEDMPILTDMVNTIETYAEYRSALEQLNEGDIAVQNAARLRLGSLVASQLRARASYDLDPGSLPRRTDPIEYFLGENRKGYCVHFASAGVLILRQLGVPARYVSGYVVHTNQFTPSGSSYVASVKDEGAHAWAEIWLDNVGWVPVEMTPGYDDAGIDLPMQGEQSAFLPPQETMPETAEKPEQGETPEDNQTPEETETQISPSPSPQEFPQESEENKEAERNGDDSAGSMPGVDIPGGPGAANGQEQGWGFAGEGGWAIFGQNGSLQVSHVVLAMLSIVAVVWICCRAVPSMLRRRVSWQDKIRADIENGSARKVVKLINRRLYRQLWRKRMGILVLHSDEEYLTALKQQYSQISGEEWEIYLKVVRKAVYSKENILPQEAERCLALLRLTKSG